MEELECRCLVLHFLLEKLEKNKNNSIYAAIGSSIVFGLLHSPVILVGNEAMIWRWVYLFIVFVFGYVISIFYLKFKNYTFIALLHFGWNYTTFCAMQMAKYRYRDTGFNLYKFQVPVVILMLTISIILVYNSDEETLQIFDFDS